MMKTETMRLNDAALIEVLQETCDRVAKGARFSREEQDAAMLRMSRMREEIRRIHGVQSIAVDLIRESREGR